MALNRARLGIVGAGTMGAGIAQVALEGGWEVVLFDPIPGAVARARDRIRDGLLRRAAKDAPRARAEDWAQERLARLSAVRSLDGVAGGAHIVLEAAIEELEAKRAIFRELDVAAAPETILATNTSALSVTKIAEAARRPDRVLGLHFFNPAPLLPLVEVVAGLHTAESVIDRALAIVDAWGRTPIRTADSPGFIVNRVNRPFTLEPLRLLRAGAGTVELIDAAIVAAGFPMGPFRLMDLIGIDVNVAAARGLFEAFDRAPRFRPSPIQESLVAAVHLGRKTGEGFYRYDADGRPIGPAQQFAAGPATPAARAAALDPDSIAERTILAIVNEAYRALGDRVASADDIDLALRLGANHPFGPFQWARETGLTEVAAMLDRLSDDDTDAFRPALTLLRAVRAGG
ncbi:MAG TPA: 3-hydroxyacyl-CoA dehydrogenase NAD-binding domain-containing protein [Candidatus Limnocylindrales bacterium]|nr:3-hydroxyacyl-CoA dehydrogenase NAD-binding domain-containing protein [Candidatus Limnocylindrales bacterium]